MPSLAPYVPAADSTFDTWLANLATLTTADPPSYGLTAGQALNIANAYAAWHAAFLLMLSPSTKTAAAVQAKNNERVNAEAVVRPLCQMISLNPGVGSGDKVALGLNPRTSVPAPITAPGTAPLLGILSAGPLSLVATFKDYTGSPTTKAKPYGVTRCRIVGATSVTPIVDPAALLLIAEPTKTPFLLTFDAGQGGKQLYLSGYWVTRTGLISPPAGIISFTIPTA